MCGIGGYIDFDKQLNYFDLEKMAKQLSHRGPDGSGMSELKSDYATLGFVHTRLSIIDLSSSANQPMTSSSGRFTITFNGEIYNYKEIKRELEGLGILFKTNSDTEVILESIAYWGIDSINKFIGMFSFALYDSSEQKIYMVRDRAGVKPFYYYYNNNSLLFASELKAFTVVSRFQKTIDKNGVALFLQYGYIPAPYSIFKHTYKLMPGSYLVIDLKTKSLTTSKYWNLNSIYEHNKNTNQSNEKQIITDLNELLVSSINYRTVADVDVGVFLSGGYDSSIALAIYAQNYKSKCQAFTLGYDNREFDEIDDAKAIAKHLRVEHHTMVASINDIKETIEKIPVITDEPLADQSIIPTYLVSRFASKKVKTVISGDGGDEIFGGYPRFYSILNRFNEYQKIPGFAKTSAANLLKLSSLSKTNTRAYNLKNSLIAKNVQAYSKSASQIFNENEIRNLLGIIPASKGSAFDNLVKLDNPDYLKELCLLEYQTYLTDNCLAKVDRCSMASALEAREPFIDHRIIEFASSINSAKSNLNNEPKYLLKKIADLYFPENYLNRPKKGFGIPMKSWLSNELSYLVDELISDNYISKLELISESYISNIINSYKSEQTYNSTQRLWCIIVLNKWVKTYFFSN